MKVSPSGLFKKNKRRKIDRHASRCRIIDIPLVTGDRAEGVLTVRLDSSPTLEQRELLDAFAAQLALFVNKERALEESRTRRSRVNRKNFRKTLFDSVSHELKTPLAAMSGALQQPEPDRAELQQAVTPPHSHGRSSARRDPSGIGSAPTGARMVRAGRSFARSGRGRRIERQRRPHQRRQKFARLFSSILA